MIPAYFPVSGVLHGRGSRPVPGSSKRQTEDQRHYGEDGGSLVSMGLF